VATVAAEPQPTSTDVALEADSPSASAKFGIVDLFAGIGCVARGFEATGRFEPIALVDIDLDARRTWEHNHAHADYLASDVATLTPADLLESADGRTISGIVGCPPCQGFSAAGQRRADDERNQLLGSFFDVIRAASPMFFVMENVPAILQRSELLAHERALDGRYLITAGLMNAALYGLPQTRERAVVIGIDRELGVRPSLPPPSHLGKQPIYSYARGRLLVPSIDTFDELLGASPQIGVKLADRQTVAKRLPSDPGRLAPLVNVWDAIGDLPILDAMRSEPVATVSGYAASLGAGVAELTNHSRWGHARTTVERLRDVAEGGRMRTERRYYSQAYTRLHRRGLARTITTNFHNAGCGRFTHPLEARTITVREAARLQGIPDEFEFIESGELQERLVGNAFPQPLAEAIARHLAGQLASVGVASPPA
jgi:DNA (cytosine-5)-methyltransferase 1